MYIIEEYFSDEKLETKSKIFKKDLNFVRPVYIILLTKGLKNNTVFVK